MSGKYISSGIEFNKGKIGLNKEDFYNLKIESANFYIMNLIKYIGGLGGIFQLFNAMFLPFVNRPKVSLMLYN